MTAAVSVVIPVFNGERYLAEAIESVLAQSHPAAEIVIVDDGSADTSAAIARSFGGIVQHELQPHGGIGHARNRGAELCRGDFISYLDADDLWAPEKLERQLAAFDGDPSLDIVSAHVRHFHSPELDPETVRRIHCPTHLIPGHFFAALTRRGLFDRVGPFVTDWILGETIDWYIRALDAGAHVRILEEALVARRLHTTNHTILHRTDHGDYARMVKAALDRRRASARTQDRGAGNS